MIPIITETQHWSAAWRQIMERRHLAASQIGTESRSDKQEREWWDRHWGKPKGVTTRERGTIPGCVGETPPLNKDQRLMDKYNLSPNDPQWVFEMCKRVEDHGKD